MTDLPDTDYTQRFIFDDSDTATAGFVGAQLRRSTGQTPVSGAGCATSWRTDGAASLLVGTLKFDGLLILQARSDGPIPLLMIECSSEREIRGLARYEADQIPADTNPRRPDAERRAGVDSRPDPRRPAPGHR